MSSQNCIDTWEKNIQHPNTTQFQEPFRCARCCGHPRSVTCDFPLRAVTRREAARRLSATRRTVSEGGSASAACHWQGGLPAGDAGCHGGNTGDWSLLLNCAAVTQGRVDARRPGRVMGAEWWGQIHGLVRRGSANPPRGLFYI